VSIDLSLMQPGDLRATCIPGFDVIASWHSGINRNPAHGRLRERARRPSRNDEKDALSFWLISGVRSQAAAVAINGLF
jgi:hypothetical protein